jgi:hypothetical protein
MPLKVDLVAVVVCALAVQEVIERHLVQSGGRSIRGYVAADPVLDHVGPDHHGHGVPTDDALDPALDLPAARIRWFLADGDCVDVRSVGRERNADAGLLSVDVEFLEELTHPLGSLVLQHPLQALEPLLRFNGLVAAEPVVVGHGTSRRDRCDPLVRTRDSVSVFHRPRWSGVSVAVARRAAARDAGHHDHVNVNGLSAAAY